jgi:eukaryotic-like serine/threonine-protein kinase
MDPERWQHVKQVLGATLDRDPSERSSFLAEVCGSDIDLRAEVESLLESHEEAGLFMDQPAIDARALDGDDLTGKTVGSYRIVSKIGQGGMGTVYKAVRADDQFQQQVAIKLLNRGMDTAFIVRRFRNERQILASLDHPNIARLLDGGATSAGLPYFVMEYIDGVPLHEWCDAHRLSITERLKLFRKVCAAVHYAHQNLVVHRDLKPSNILVNAEGQPKLLDFGIAKLLSADDGSGAGDPTITMYRMMTPDYASPEQVRGERITTASDIYSLGVILYELLTGHRPYRVATQAPSEIEEMVCMREPDKPSTVIQKVEEVKGASVTPEVVSKTREGSPEKLCRRLRGDLDNIIMMAMRKEPERRYVSAGQLSTDIRRHLEGFAVIARADTVVYRASKFVRRHRMSVGAAALVMLALVGGIIATAWQAHVANLERMKAEHRFNDVRELANSFIFDLHDKIESLPGSTSARELLVQKALKYINSLAHESKGDPTLERELAEVYLKIGDVQGRPYKANLGNTAGALDSYQKAFEILRRLSAGDPANEDVKRRLAASHDDLCAVYEAMGRAGGAEDHCREALDLRRQISAAQPDNRIKRRELADAHTDFANALQLSGKWSEVKDHRNQAIAIYQELSAADPVDQDAQMSLSNAYMKLGRTLILTKEYAVALVQQRKSLDLNVSLVQQSPADPRRNLNLSFCYFFIAALESRLGNPARALELSRKALEMREDLATADPQDARLRMELAASYGQVGSILTETGDARVAEQQLQKRLAIEQGLLATDPIRTEHETGVAEAEEQLGALETRLADKAGSEADRLRHFRAARAWYQKASDIYRELQSRGTLIAEFAPNLPDVSRRIAAIEEQLRAPSHEWSKIRKDSPLVGE